MIDRSDSKTEGLSKPNAEDAIELRSASGNDLDDLACMNHELIQDERDRNPMNVQQLKERFQRFLSEEGWSVDLFCVAGEAVGYATYRYEPDVSEPSGFHVYLRQFYIKRDKRGGNIGRRALAQLMRDRFKPGDRVFLNVLEVNTGGRAFWSRTGFVPYSTTMETVVQNMNK